MVTFGQRLRDLRRARGISLREMASRIDRDYTYLSKIETGACRPPSADVILALAIELESDPEELAILGDKPAIAVVRQQLVDARAERDAAITRASAEHAARVALVNAMSELLPRIVEGGGYCCKACWTVAGHAEDCAYVAALAAVAEAGRSVEP